MIIEVRDIPSEGRGYHLDYAWADKEGAGREAVCSGQVVADLQVTRTGGALAVAGTVKAALRLACSRCLEEYPHVEEFAFRQVHVPCPETPVEGLETELHDEEMDIDFYREQIDLEAAVDEEILLRLPIQALCREGCLGLCPVCGADMNAQPCAGHEEGSDPRWQALKIADNSQKL